METSQLEQLVRSSLAQVYAAPVVRVDDDRVLVLGGKALERARNSAQDAGLDRADERVDAIDFAVLPWYAVPAAGMQLWRQHGSAGSTGEMVTELLDGDPPVQVIAAHESWQLIRTIDGATGWLAPEAANEVAHTDQVAAPGADVMTLPGEFNSDAFAATCETFVGVPYRWGGVAPAGVDCSGLVQRAAYMSNQCWLPRHSTHLMHIGQRVAPSAMSRGDVLVLRRDMSTIEEDAPVPSRSVGGRHPMHVAVALDTGTVVHASRDAWSVITEPASALRERYRVLAVRRLGTSGGGVA